MLVLSRKVGESLTIGADVTIRLIRINGNQVRLGIEAPESVRVLRSELHTADEPSEPGLPPCPLCQKSR